MKSKVFVKRTALAVCALLMLFAVAIAAACVGKNVGGQKAAAMTALPAGLKPGDFVYNNDFVRTVSDESYEHKILSGVNVLSGGEWHSVSEEIPCYAVNDIPGNDEYLRKYGDQSLIVDNADPMDYTFTDVLERGKCPKFTRHFTQTPEFETVSPELYRLTGVSIVYGFDKYYNHPEKVQAYSEIEAAYKLSGYELTIDPEALGDCLSSHENYKFCWVTFVVVYHYELTVDPLPLPEEPSKEGHTFAGWYYGPETEHGDGEACVPYDGSPIFEETDFHAHWNIDRHTVTYETGENGSEVLPIEVDWGMVLSGEQIAAPTRIGYNFLGWFIDDDTQYTNQPIKDDTTLTAHWEIKKFTVTFYVDGEEYRKETVEYGTRLIEVLKTVGLTNYAISLPTGVRVSKASTVITDDVSLEVSELSGFEKFGDFVGTNPWFTWTMLGVGLGLACLAAVGIMTILKR